MNNTSRKKSRTAQGKWLPLKSWLRVKASWPHVMSATGLAPHTVRPIDPRQGSQSIGQVDLLQPSPAPPKLKEDINFLLWTLVAKVSKTFM